MVGMRPRLQQHPQRLLTAALSISSLGLVAGPLLCLWLATRLGGTSGLVLGVLGCPVVLTVWIFGVSRLNCVYVRACPSPRPVLELSVTVVVIVAVISLLVWTLLLGARGPDLPLRVS